MPTLSIFYGIVIRMYFADHSPPHFHALYSGYQAQIDIKTLRVIKGSLPRQAKGWKGFGKRRKARTGRFQSIPCLEGIPLKTQQNQAKPGRGGRASEERANCEPA